MANQNTSPDEIESEWGKEIARRLAELDAGSAETIPAEEAEAKIRGDAREIVADNDERTSKLK